MPQEKKIVVIAAILIALSILDAHATCLIGLEANPLINCIQSLSGYSFTTTIVTVKLIAIFFIFALSIMLIMIHRSGKYVFAGLVINVLYILIIIYSAVVATSYAHYFFFKN
ncbi:MAG: hypothetical protein HYT37_01925 [Candidatus Sungbacteria bacterium]|nr:hypothetical protein [Candidatus Sungbacteria bacterium]